MRTIVVILYMLRLRLVKAMITSMQKDEWMSRSELEVVAIFMRKLRENFEFTYE